MLLLFGFLLLVFGVAFILFTPALWGREIYYQCSAPRAVTCPETHRQVGVTIDASHAAVTGLRGHSDFRLSDCTRWPERADCEQDCLPEALRNPPYTLGEVHFPKAHRQIYHLPVLLAAFAAAYVGMWWHSQYLFRGRWMTALGLTPEQLKEMVHWYSPHLLSVGACLLFAYGVAWLQTVQHRKGIRWGILSAIYPLGCPPACELALAVDLSTRSAPDRRRLYAHRDDHSRSDHRRPQRQTRASGRSKLREWESERATREIC